MVEVKKYKLSPTPLVPNSPHPVLHYPGFLCAKGQEPTALRAYDLFSAQGWKVQWVTRYGYTQDAHYHSSTHECMAVLTGSATIRLGLADMDEDRDGGIEVQANVGDVFVLPAGVVHKTMETSPRMPFQFLTPGNGHSLGQGEAGKVRDEEAERKAREVMANVELSGFTMLGAYPPGGVWDFALGGESEGAFDKVWAVPLPERDPVLGDSPQGLRGIWREE